MTTVRRWTGSETRALRQAMRMSIRGFASYLGVGVRTVAGWESSAGVSPRPEMQAALDTALARASDEVKARFALTLDTGRPEPHPIRPGAVVGAPSALLAPREWNRHTTGELAAFLAGDTDVDDHAALRLAHEWRIVDPPQVTEVHAGRRVGERLARVIEERIEALRRMDDVLGGGEVHDLVHRELRVTLDLLRGASYPEKTGRRLLGAVADLCQLAGWVAGDAGLYPIAERYYLGGVSAAHAADDRPLAAHLLSSLAYQKANVGDPREAVLLARSAEQGAVEATSGRTRALLYGRIAWASARCGDAPAVDRALVKVDQALETTEAEAEPSWLYWLDRDEAQIMAGRCMTELRRAAPAVKLLEDAIGRYDDTRARELALYLSWLAEAHVYSNNIDEAARVSSVALQLSALVSSVRCHARLRTLRGLLSQYRQSAAVREFEEEARQVLGPP